jgi:hypothetical protein
VDFDAENDGEVDNTFELPDITDQIGDIYAEEKLKSESTAFETNSHAF